MSEWQLWIGTGIGHIADINGYDHILFVMLVVLSYPLKEWKKLLGLVTGFTVGHSISLALSVAQILSVNTYLVEIGIVLTILATAIYHMINYQTEVTEGKWLFFLIPFFGGIHGMGFSTLLRSMLGNSGDIAFPLLCFNLGLEIGQLMIVGFALLFSLLLTLFFHFPFKYYKLFISCSIAIVSVVLLLQRV